MLKVRLLPASKSTRAPVAMALASGVSLAFRFLVLGSAPSFPSTIPGRFNVVLDNVLATSARGMFCDARTGKTVALYVGATCKAAPRTGKTVRL